MLQKVIIQGNLHFGTKRSYEKAVRMYEHRLEAYYKSELVTKDQEELFNDDELTLEVPRLVTQTSDKYWKNTIDILSYLAQFAVAGKVCAWMLEDGKILDYHLIEPDSDKTVVRNYHKGKKFVNEEGKAEDAFKALNRVLKKYDKHSQAYERRGHLNYLLGNTDEALHDFSKAIHIDRENADAYYGRGRVYVQQSNYEKAIEDFENCAKNALALQPVYWMARRLLSECYMQTGNLVKAEFNLKLFTKRPFEREDPNYTWKQWAFFKYGKVLLELEKFDEAGKAFDQALAIEEGHQSISKPERLTFRGIAKLKSGSKGYLSDWKEAASLGYDKAETLLKEHA